jgi:tetratricopeptide (TPR) repeat protein
VMGHELAHVVAGRFGEGPFRVSGPLGGWFPDPGRIEGVATAATPSDDPEFTLQEWSRAMLDLGLLPPLAAVFRLSFLGENSSTAYTVAGAFIEWLHDTYGPEAVRGWYSGAPLERVTGGKTLSTLEAEWRSSLGRLKLPPQALISARARFDRPAIFGRKCPHVVDRLTGEAHGRLAQGDFRGAKERFEQVLRLDPQSFPARMGLGSCALRAGDEAEARRRWGELARDPELHRLLQLAAEEAIADLDLSAGHMDAAKRRYAEIAENVSDEDRLRTLDVKSNPGSDLGRQAVAALLVGDPQFGRDFSEAAALLGRWSAAEPDNGLPDYLLGRNFYLGGRYPSAQRELDRARSRSITLPRVEVEAVRMQLIVACAQNDLTRARAALTSWNALAGSVDPGERDAVAQMARRCGATD